jgi:hypothetical protein
MDFGQAAILTFVFVGLISEAKSLVWGTMKERITIGLVNVVAIVTVFLVATSAWADSQIIGDKNLGALGWSSLLLVAVVLGGSASGLWQAFDTIKNVGQNSPKVYDPKYGTPATKALPPMTSSSANTVTTPVNKFEPTPLPEPPPGYGPVETNAS